MNVRNLVGSILVPLDEVQQEQIDSVARSLALNPDTVEEYARETDPTPNFKYGTWLLKRWKNQDFDLSDTGWRSRVHDRLSTFDRAKKLGVLTGDAANISTYIDFINLSNTVDKIPLEKLVSKRDIKRGKADPYLVPGSTRTHSSENVRVYRVETLEACMFHGRGTEWCTRGTEHAQEYTERGPLYVIYEKTTAWEQTGSRPKSVDTWRKSAQYTYDYEEFNNTDNQAIDGPEIFNESFIRPDEALAAMQPDESNEAWQDEYEALASKLTGEGEPETEGISSEALEVANEYQHKLYRKDAFGGGWTRVEHVNLDADTWVQIPEFEGSMDEPLVRGNIEYLKRGWGGMFGGDSLVVDIRQGDVYDVSIRLGTEDTDLWDVMRAMIGPGETILDSDFYDQAKKDILFDNWDVNARRYQEALTKHLEEEVTDEAFAVAGVSRQEIWEAIDSTGYSRLLRLFDTVRDYFGLEWEWFAEGPHIDMEEVAQFTAIQDIMRIYEIQSESEKEKARGQKFFPYSDSRVRSTVTGILKS